MIIVTHDPAEPPQSHSEVTDPVVIKAILRSLLRARRFNIDYEFANLKERRLWGLYEAVMRGCQAMAQGRLAVFSVNTYQDYSADSDRLWKDLKAVHGAGFVLTTHQHPSGSVYIEHEDSRIPELVGIFKAT